MAFSSGNHAQGVALAARLLGIPALIVMPADAPKVKAQATAGYGAEIRFYDRLTESREQISAEIAAQRGAILVPAFDDPHIIAGQGTVGLELVRQAQALGVTLGAVAAPCSGGGLLAGVATAVKALSPSTAIWGVEPAGYDDTAKSLRWCSPMPKKSSPTWSARTASATTFRSTCGWGSSSPAASKVTSPKVSSPNSIFCAIVVFPQSICMQMHSTGKPRRGRSYSGASGPDHRGFRRASPGSIGSPPTRASARPP